MPADVVQASLSSYGDVESVGFRKAVDHFRSDDHIVTMMLKRVILRNVVVAGYSTIVYYNELPFCEICLKDHFTSGCPLKGKHRMCRVAGHVVRNYPQKRGVLHQPDAQPSSGGGMSQSVLSWSRDGPPGSRLPVCPWRCLKT